MFLFRVFALIELLHSTISTSDLYRATSLYRVIYHQSPAWAIFSSMRSQNQPHGKFYKVLLPTETNQEHTPTNVRLPEGARGHMVVVLGWACRWNWVKVATVSKLCNVGLAVLIGKLVSRSRLVPPLHHNTSTTFLYILRRKTSITEFSWNFAMTGTAGPTWRRSLTSK